MDQRLVELAARAAAQHGAFSVADAESFGVGRAMRSSAVRRGAIEPIGTSTFRFAGASVTWHQEAMAGLLDLGREAVICGRAAAVLHGLDGFGWGEIDFLLPRPARGRVTPMGTVHSTLRPLPRTDTVTRDGLRVLNATRLILEGPLCGFSQREIDAAIDSAVRLKCCSLDVLADRVASERSAGVNHSRRLVRSLLDAGGESYLERRFLRVLRLAGMPRPELQVIHRSGKRTIARVDALFPGGLVVELAGHGPHGNRRQGQIDAERHTELTLRGLRVLTFTYDDLIERPQWVLAKIREGLRQVA